MNHRIIYLNGFMAAGKSTIGPILANTLGWDFYDLDKVIETELGCRITDIFKEKGEPYFRQKEAEVLARLSNLTEVVISLGGGTSCHNNNLDLMIKTGKIVYLKASPEALYQRLKNKKDRPVFNTGNEERPKDELKNKIIMLLDQRAPYYEKADLIINTDESSLGHTVDRIAKLITRTVNEKN